MCEARKGLPLRNQIIDSRLPTVRAYLWAVLTSSLFSDLSFLPYPISLYSFILYPLWKEEGIYKWLDKHMSMILSCLARSFKSSQRETHQILQIPISPEFVVRYTHSKTKHLTPNQRC